MSELTGYGHTQLRLFFGLWPDPLVRECIATELAELVDGLDGRQLPPANYHVTMAFLGEVAITDLAEIQAAAQRVRVVPFELQLTHTGYWPNTQIAWLGADGCPPELSGMVNALTTELIAIGIQPQTEPYEPHVSLARRASGCAQIRLAAPISWQVDGFALLRSEISAEGSVYTQLEQYSAGD
jgi:2'-5' RNA ligase